MSNRDSSGKTLIHPAPQFVSDLTRLVIDADRLMGDLDGKNGKPKSGKPSGAIGVLRHQTQWLVDSIRQSASLFDHVPVPLMELDEKGKVVRTNKECTGILDALRLPLLGKSLFHFTIASETKQLQKDLEIARHSRKPRVVRLTAVRGGKQSSMDLRICRQSTNGTPGYLAAVASAELSREKHAAFGPERRAWTPGMPELILELSRTKTLQAAVECAGNYYAKAFQSPVGMLFLEDNGDLQLIFKWRSRQIPKEYLEEEAIKRGPVARTHRTGETAFWTPQGATPSKISRTLDRLLRQSGCHTVAFTPIAAPKERPIGVVALVLPHDADHATRHSDLVRRGQIISAYIARLREYEHAVAARIKAEKAVQVQEEFLSVLSHELKNSITPILGWSVALSSGALASDKQNQALEGIVRNVRTLNYMIEDLFDVARISTGKLRLQPSEIRIQDVAREALVAIQLAVESKKLRISTDIEEAIPSFMADARRLQQTLVNLLNNAAKFTPPGGAISLQVHRCGDDVECIVSDTGRGIEPKFLPFAFDKFRQAHSAGKPNTTAGLGLGLAIAREIVELHQGSIRAFSEGAGKGSTFTVRLPIHRKHVRRGEEAAASNPFRP
jgi:signal transduction histidine kinase